MKGRDGDARAKWALSFRLRNLFSENSKVWSLQFPQNVRDEVLFTVGTSSEIKDDLARVSDQK